MDCGASMTTQQGYFLIADITGYTQYLSASELDHAQQTLTALLNLLIQHTRPPLIISRLAGDAVISYGLRDNFFQGQTFIEMIEDTYVSFRRAIELMVHNTTCPCNACRNIGTLDLKFFVHFGTFAVQKLDAHDELIGSDVNLIHRLTKNHVTEATGLRAYTLYTEAAIGQLGLGDDVDDMATLEETYEHLDGVRVFVQDMHPVWEVKKHEVQISIPPEKELLRVAADIALSPEQVWDYLVQPEHYRVLTGGTRIEIANRNGARVATGSVFQCYHRDGSMVALTILEWQPFERMVSQYALPIPIKGTFGLTEIRLEPIEGGTRLTQILSKSTGPLPGRIMGDIAFRQMVPGFQADMDRFKAHVEADFAEHGSDLPSAATITEAMIGAAARASLSAA